MSWETDFDPDREREQESVTDDAGWDWLGVGPTDTAGRIKLPRTLLEEGVFDEHDEAFWGHETTTGTLVISPEPLAVENYETVASRKIGGAADGHRCTVPHQYTPGGSEQPHIVMQAADATFDGDERVHFVCHDAVLERETPWYFVLPQSEFERRLLGAADWPETVFPESTRLL